MRRPIPRILLVDDTDDILLLFRHALHDVARVATANCGMDALKAYEQARANGEPFDLLLLDIAMQDLTGFEVAAAVRATGDEATQIAFVTAYNEPATYATAQRFNAAVWPKPVTAEELREKVCELVRC